MKQSYELFSFAELTELVLSLNKAHQHTQTPHLINLLCTRVCWPLPEYGVDPGRPPFHLDVGGTGWDPMCWEIGFSAITKGSADKMYKMCHNSLWESQSVAQLTAAHGCIRNSFFMQVIQQQLWGWLAFRPRRCMHLPMTACTKSMPQWRHTWCRTILPLNCPFPPHAVSSDVLTYARDFPGPSKMIVSIVQLQELALLNSHKTSLSLGFFLSFFFFHSQHLYKPMQYRSAIRV